MCWRSTCAGQRCTVEPGIVLDELNRRLRPHGLWFPVDISTASRATIGGMVGNNSCGARSLRYGNTRENVLSIDAVLADGASAHFGPAARDLSDLPRQSPLVPLARDLLALGGARGRRDRNELSKSAAPGRRLQSRRAGARPQRSQSRAHSRRLRGHARVLHQDRAEALAAARAARGRRLPFRQLRQGDGRRAAHRQARADRGRAGRSHHARAWRATSRCSSPRIDAVVRGDPAAILFVEFAEEDQYENLRRLMRLKELMGDLGLGWDKTGAAWGGVVDVLDARLQAAITDMRTAGLNIMMSMKEEGKPISFVEDCAVPLEHLADYTARLTDIFEKHGTRGTWYAHASVGCLHVRPVLNLRLEQRRQGDARDRRGSLRHGARLQGLAFGRARRRHRALGIPREDVRPASSCARSRRSRTQLRSRRPLQSRQDRACAEIRRPHPLPLRAGLSCRRDRCAARLVGLSRRRRRFPGRGRDVQQQRRLPRARRRRHVPELPRHPRRARRHPRARQHAAPRHHPASSDPTR